MSDDRLFASNNAIGRKWYFLNLITLAFITIATQYFFDNHIITNVKTEVYEIITTWTLYIIYVIYIVTFFSLIERRLYDISATRDSSIYKNFSAILKFAVCFQLLVIIGQHCEIQVGISYNVLQYIAYFFDGIFIFIAFIIGFINGKISNMTYEQYKNQIKYK